jgi:hypothetical protein
MSDRKAGKTANKTAKTAPPSPKSGVSLPLGAHEGNTGGKPGRSGRPPKAFKDFLAELRRDPDAQAALEAAAKNPKSPGFRSAWQLAAQYDTEKPGEKHEHTITDVTPEQLDSEIGQMVKQLAARRKAVVNGNGNGRHG